MSASYSEVAWTSKLMFRSFVEKGCVVLPRDGQAHIFREPRSLTITSKKCEPRSLTFVNFYLVKI